MIAGFRPAPGHAEVERAVRASGWIANGEAVRVHPLSRTHARVDWLERHAFLLTRADGTKAHLTLGSGLDHTWEWINTFHRACPTITCQPLHFGFASGWQVLAVAWFDGHSLESVQRDASHTKPAPDGAVSLVQSALAATEQPSTREAAVAELAQFETEVAALPIFTDADQSILTTQIFPLIRAGALAGPCVTRLSNGDFVARNILVDEVGAVRLIDHEFAARTHLYGADLWRWRVFGGDSTPCASAGAPIPEWLEAYAILQQLMLACRTHGPLVAMYEASLRLRRLATIASSRPMTGAGSTIQRAFTGELQPARRAAPPQMAVAQLFWGASPEFCEEASSRQAYPLRHDCMVRFTIPAARGILHLRLDPSEQAGTATVSHAALGYVDGREGEDATCVSPLAIEAGTTTVLHGATLGRPDSPLTVQCLDDDPALRLPPISLGHYVGDLVVEIRVRFEPTPNPPPHLSDTAT